MRTKHIISLLAGILFLSRVGAQNVPEVGTSPSGSVTVITAPPAPTTTMGLNVVQTTVPILPVTDVTALSNLGSSDKKQSYSYSDGFNRVYQTVQSNVSNTNGTLQHGIQIADTRFQKDGYSFLPYTSSNTGLQADAFQTQKNYYNDLYPGEGYTSYSRSTHTGLNSNVSYAPGKSQTGQDRGTIVKRMSNVAGQVRTWDLDGNGKPISTGTYDANELFVEEVIAASAAGTGHYTAGSSMVFTDKDGRVVLKVVCDSSYTYGSGVPQPATTYQNTYYVYDDMGRLRYTIPPRAMELIEQNSWTVNTTVLNNLCFQYRYDDKGRLSAQQYPGEQGFSMFVYDRKQRLVMRQSPKEVQSKDYEVTLYDAFNRVTATSLYHDLSSRDDWQNFFDNYTGNLSSNDIRYYMGYPYEGLHPTDDAVAGNVMLSYAWYDHYNGVDDNSTRYNTYNPQLQFSNDYLATAGAETPVRSLRTRGQLTATMHKILRSPNAASAQAGDWTTGRNYYDDKGRLINQLKLDFSDNGNQLLHYQYSGTQYDFLNRALISKSIFRNLYASATVYREWSKNEYQAGTGALLKSSHKVNDGTWTTQSQYTYDALGKVQRKSLGGGGEVQDYSYNIRGQLTGINAIYAETGDKGGESRTFGESLKYDYGFSTPQYNGKLAGMIWRGGNGSTAHAYGYSYDQSGRLKNAEYRSSGATIWNKNTLDYTVSNIHYDKNGNLLSMDQQGVTPTNGIQTIDQIRYNYEDNEQSNHLLKAQDNTSDYNLGDFVNTNGTSNDYSYDLNGNLEKDNNKGISSITYNFFNKPQIILFTNGKKLEYTYDAAGTKLQELVIEPGTILKNTDYVGGYIYEGNKLRYLLTGEGRTVRDTVTDAFKEEYFVKDHLGNVRSTIDVIQYPLLQYFATYELASANLEGLLFDQVSEIRSDKPGSTSSADAKSGRLNGEDQPMGTSLLLHVMAGDQVELNVNNYYDSYDPDNDNPVDASTMLGNIIGTLTGGQGGFEGSESHNPDMVEQLFSPENYLGEYRNIVNNNTNTTQPRAYLNYILFDENMRIDKTFSNAYQVNGNGSWEEIGTTAPLTIPVNGYLAVYLSNESQVTGCYSCGDVHFDLLRVKLQKGHQLEEEHYYPFGLPMKGLSSAADNNTIVQKRKYQSNEYIQDLGLNWMDFHARQYDPQLGRFLGVDPLAADQGQDMFSPYAAMGNAPESMVDPNGMQFRPNNPVVSENTGGDGAGYKPFKLNFEGFGGGNGGGSFGSSGSNSAFWNMVSNTLYKTTGTSVINNQGNGTFAVNLNRRADGEKTGDGAFDNTSTIPEGIASLAEVNVTKPYLIRIIEDFRRFNSINEAKETDVDPSTLGHNVFWTNYIGPWNPKDFNGYWNYAIAPVSRLDGYAKKHDLAYDRAKVSGLGGVLFSTDAINADYSLVYGAYNLTFNKDNVSISERMQGLAVGTFIGLFVFPKSIYYMGQAAGQNEKSNMRSGNWIGNLDH